MPPATTLTAAVDFVSPLPRCANDDPAKFARVVAISLIHRRHEMRSCAFVVVITSFMIFSALAADLSPPVSSPTPSPILPSYSWTGWYGGLQLGGAWEKSNWRVFSQTGSGFLYGGQLGVNYQIDQFVFGAEGDVSGSTLKADSICAAVAGTNCRTTMDYLASLRARAGVAFDRVMPYVDGGVAFGGFRFAQTAGLNQSWSDMVHIG